MPASGSTSIMLPITPASPAAICPWTKAEPVPSSVSTRDRAPVVRIRGRFHSAYPRSASSSGTMESTHTVTMTRAERLRSVTSGGVGRPGSMLRRIGRILPNRSGTPATSPRM